jgi:hypothetical protein
MGINADGRREHLDLKVGDSESEGFRREFIAALQERSLTGVRLGVSGAHVGLTKAMRRQLQGAPASAAVLFLPETCCSGFPRSATPANNTSAIRRKT